MTLYITDTSSIVGPKAVVSDNESSIKISGFEVVASYNWLDESNPTVLVPGIPPTWSPPAIPPCLRPDSGPCFVDQNADRNPSSPMEPAIRAVQVLQPDFDFAAVHLVTDRRPLRNLFGFVDGELDAFRFGVEIIGTTAILSRMEKETRQKRSKGYRQHFEESYTKLAAAAKGSTSHHRIVSYSFGGLKLLVRSAVDAYIENLEAPAKTTDREGYNSDEVTVVRGGQKVPQAAMMELTARYKFSRHPFELQQKMADLWISQTPIFVEVYHRHSSQPEYFRKHMNVFDKIQIKYMRETLDRWESANARALKPLSIVLGDVIEAVGRIGCPCVVSCEGGFSASLEVSGVEGEKIPGLPEDLRALFKTRDANRAGGKEP